jgi:N-acetylmuramoyl-L-alanine amidase CwlA
MNYRQLEEAINKWTLDLEEQEKIFLNQATQVNAWDRLLVNNGEKIVSLYDAVEKVKLDQQVNDEVEVNKNLILLQQKGRFFSVVADSENSSVVL